MMTRNESSKNRPPMPSSAIIGPTIGAAAAMTAAGTAIAAQAWGMWFGMMTGAMNTAKTGVPSTFPSFGALKKADHWGDDEPESGALSPKSAEPTARATAAAETLGAEIESVTNEFQRASRKIAEAVSGDIEAAIDTAQTIARANPICAPLVPEKKASARAPVAKRKSASKKADNSNKVEAKQAASGKSVTSPPEDLKAISGIGPKLEQLLNKAGIHTFAQIAEWAAEDIAGFDRKFALMGRIERDDWIGQARKLMANGNN